jgi:hypothetical protein
MAQAKGMRLQCSIASVFTTVAKVQDFDEPSYEKEFADNTGIDETDVLMKEQPTGFLKPKDMTFEVLYEPTNALHMLLEDKAEDTGTTGELDFKILNPVASSRTKTFKGHVTSFVASHKKGAFQVAKVTVKPTTLVTRA